MSDNVIEVALRANTANLVAGLKEAASVTGNAGAQMREDIAGLGSGAKDASPHVFNLKETLVEYGQHVRGEHRATMLLAGQVASLGFASKGAAAEVTGLVAGLAFGGGLGLAVEAVKLVAHGFGDLAEAEEKAKEEMKKFADELVADTEKVKKWSEQTLLALRGASRAELQAHQEIKPLLEERQKLENAIGVMQSNVAEARDTEATNEFEAMAKIAPEDEKKLARMREELRILNEQIAARQKAIGAVATEEVKQDTAKEAEEAAKRFAQKEKLQKDHLMRVSKAEFDAMKALQKMGDDNLAQRVQIDQNFENIEAANKEKRDREQKERLAELKKEIKEVGAEGIRFGTAFGTAFAGIAAGTMSVTKAFSEMAKATVRLIFDMVKKAIEAYALQAAAAAAAANAGIPGVGVFVAMAAAAAMEAAVMALLDSLPSAAVGMPHVPMDMPVFVHQGERILTKQENEDYGAGGRGGGGRGGDTHLHFPNALVVDGQSMRRLFNDPNYVREFRDATRRGRL